MRMDTPPPDGNHTSPSVQRQQLAAFHQSPEQRGTKSGYQRIFRPTVSSKKRQVSINPHYRWRLAPKNFEGSNPNRGLGLLSFVTRTLAEQENLELYCTLNSLADKPTTAEIEKTIPCTPKILDNADVLITLLFLNQLALVQIIGDRVPPPREIQCLIDALYDNYKRLTGLSNFRPIVSTEIVYQLCRHLEQYFDLHCTEAEVLARNFPKFNIDFLIHGVENNNLTMSYSYSPIFAPLRTAPKAMPPIQETSRRS
jgi:hypothetical protein